MTIRLAIVDPDPVFATEVEAEFGLAGDVEIVGSQTSWDNLPDWLDKLRPGVAVFGPGWARTKVLEMLPHLKEKAPGLRNVVLTAEYSAELKRQVLGTGGFAVLPVPVDSRELLTVIKKAGRAGEASAAPAPPLKHPGKIVTVFSTKGGVGKTVVATNLAIALSKKQHATVVIVDMDIQFGDVGVMLKLKPKHTIYDLTELETLDKDQLEGYLTAYDERVRALLAPLQPELADLVPAKLVPPVLTLLRESADYVIVDTPPCFNDNVLAVLDQTDELFVLATMDLPALKNIQLCLKTLQLLSFPTKKIRLMLNRADKNLGLSVSDIEKSIGMRLTAVIPNDVMVPLAVNKGVPVVLDSPKCEAAKGLLALSAELSRNGNSHRSKAG